jgi:hypothetical protein
MELIGCLGWQVYLAHSKKIHLKMSCQLDFQVTDLDTEGQEVASVQFLRDSYCEM